MILSHIFNSRALSHLARSASRAIHLHPIPLKRTAFILPRTYFTMQKRIIGPLTEEKALAEKQQEEDIEFINGDGTDPIKIENISDFNVILNGAPISCSGELSPSIRVKLRTDSGIMEFPPPQASLEEQNKKMKELISLCKPATFGRGTEEVLDDEYRSALVLSPDSFMTDFHPADCNILNDVKKILGGHYDHVSCQLYRLNIYPAGGFFKIHKDTPRGANHLGSLVVTLPFPHQGGKLMIRKGYCEDIFDSSWKGDGQNAVKWVALYGDCDHWIEPVTSGYRVTLTYHLYASVNLESTFNFASQPIYSMLQKMLQQNIFKENQKYGFFLRHEYSSEELVIAKKDPMRMLRQSDAILYSAAVSLGLKVELCSIFREDHFFYKPESYKDLYLISNQIPETQILDNIDDILEHEFLKEQYGAKIIKGDDVVWCTDIPKTIPNLGGCVSVYGNEPSPKGLYYHAVFVITKVAPTSDPK